MTQRPGRSGAAVLAAAGLTAGTLAAGTPQPISTSLVECSVIHDALADLGTRKGRDDRDIARMRRGALRFAEAALREARREGVTEPGPHLAARRDDLASKWSGRFASLLRVRETLEWIEYCRALGEARGVLPVPD